MWTDSKKKIKNIVGLYINTLRILTANVHFSFSVFFRFPIYVELVEVYFYGDFFAQHRPVVNQTLSQKILFVHLSM